MGRGWPRAACSSWWQLPLPGGTFVGCFLFFFFFLLKYLYLFVIETPFLNTRAVLCFLQVESRRWEGSGCAAVGSGRARGSALTRKAASLPHAGVLNVPVPFCVIKC